MPSLPLHSIPLIKLTSLIANLAISIGLLLLGIRQIKSKFSMSGNFNELWELGFGAINEKTLITGKYPFQSKGRQGLIANTLVANLPQVYMNAL